MRADIVPGGVFPDYELTDHTKTRRRLAWMHLVQNCQVIGLEGNVLTLGFTNAGARDSFVSSGCTEIVHQAAIDVVGADWQIDTVVDPGATPEGTPVVVRSAVTPDAAAALSISLATAERHWAYARAWLHQELRAGATPQEKRSR